MKKILFLTCIYINIITPAIPDTMNVNWMVDGSVYNTSTCTVGGDLILPTTPTKRGYTFMGWSFATPIEYLESTGTQWIDTGYKPNQDTRVVISYLKPASSSMGTLFGARDGVGINCFAFLIVSGSSSQAELRTDYDDTSFYFGTTLTDIRVIVDKNKNTTNITDLQGQLLLTHTFPYSNFSTTHNMYIYTLNNSGSLGSKLGAKIYYMQIYDNDTLVRDFIPVLDHDGVPCMYDRISGTFFYNSGTGDFIAGPVIAE